MVPLVAILTKIVPPVWYLNGRSTFLWTMKLGRKATGGTSVIWATWKLHCKKAQLDHYLWHTGSCVSRQVTSLSLDNIIIKCPVGYYTNDTCFPSLYQLKMKWKCSIMKLGYNIYYTDISCIIPINSRWKPYTHVELWIQIRLLHVYISPVPYQCLFLMNYEILGAFIIIILVIKTVVFFL